VSDVLVVGGGVIGLAIGWRCAQRGLSVTVVDPAPGTGATGTAAGMLAPVSEVQFGETPLLRLNLVSASRYPGFVEELSEVSGRPVGYVRCGTVVAGWDAADLAGLRAVRDYALSLGQQVELLTGGELRAAVPALTVGLPGGLFAPNDHQVDNRLLHGALLVAAARAGVRILIGRVVGVGVTGDRVTGVTLADGGRVPAGAVVVAAGAWSAGLGLPAAARPRVHPVKGQTLRLRLPDRPVLGHIVRGAVRGSPVYVVPRADGGLVVGASSEDAGFDLRPRAGAVYELLRDAQSLLPILGEAQFVEVCTSARPGTPDNAPLIGRTPVAGLILATGHYRNGILLTPVTADGVTAVLVDGALPAELAPFDPGRFDRAKENAWT
jgi:glycine oxidase